MSNASAVEAVLFAALEKATAAERAAFLDSACAGDAELRRQVEKLLKAHANVGDFLQKPVVALLAAAPEPADDTQALDAATDGPDAVPPGRTGLYLARTEGGEAIDEKNSLAFLQSTTRPDSLGRLGHYEVLEVLGRGGFGIVFRAFDVQLQRVVAIKVLAPEMAGTALACKRFLREARSSARVRHENVVQIYTVEEEPLPYLVMEFVPGQTLQQRLDRTGHMEVTEVVQLGRQIAEGLAAAHGTGLIHRDIKPGNILIEAGPNQHVKITDFGLARAADDASLTQSGVVAGTPMFMAPEQASAGTLDHRSDLFSLGSVLYMMCSGRPPFRAPSTLAVLKRVIEDTPRPIREIIPEVPPWLCDLIARLHAKKPDDRMATAREVADLLGRGLAALQAPGSVQPPALAAPAAVPKPPPSQEAAEAAPAIQPRLGSRRWLVAAAVFLTLLGGLGVTEATGVTQVRGTVIRLFSPEGTLVVEVNDPGVSVQIEGSDLVITGAGAREIRLKPGSYTVEGRKDGKVVSRELVTVTKNGKQVVRVSQEARPDDKKGDPRTKVGPSEDRSKWTVLKPIEMRSEGGATLTLQDDGSILVSGPLPPQDSYTLTFRGLPTRMQILQLEVLPHQTLPEDGPGRHSSGQFCLTTIKAQLDPPLKTGEPRILKLAKAWADNSRGEDSRVHLAIDADDRTGWVTDVGEPHFARFELAEAVAASDETVLRVTLEFKHPDRLAQNYQLGCFRLSASQERDIGAQSDAPDRRAAEYVLSIGGAVRVDDGGKERPIKTAAELAAGAVRLTDVDIRDNNQVTDAGLAVLKDCKRLAGVHLIRTPVTDAGLLHFRGSTSLTTLHLVETPVTNAGLAHLKECRNLTWIWLESLPQVTDEGLAHLKACKNLTYLQLNTLPVTDAGLAAFNDCQNLQRLLIQNAQVGNAGLTHFKACKNLTELNLTATQVGDAGLAHLTGLTRLTRLILPKTLVTAKGVEGLANALPTCTIRWDGGVIDPVVRLAPDRRAAEYVLSVGGTVQLNEKGPHITVATDLPAEPFRLTKVNLWKKTLTAAGLAAFKDCKNLKELYLRECSQVKDLSPLKGLQLATLDLDGTQVSDLSPLQGMPLTSLNLHNCPQIRDLAPLQGMPLTELNINNGPKVVDFSPLQGMPLTKLWARSNLVHDLSPLKGMPLTSLNLNSCGQVKDLSPLKGLKLATLDVSATQVSDLSPLQGMPLTSLNLVSCFQIKDLEPLRGLPLTQLDASRTQVSDLSTLQGMPLTSLYLNTCSQIRDLKPLKGLPLTSLILSHCRQVEDLSPLKGLSLTQLSVDDTQVRNLEPLKDMPLKRLYVDAPGVTDLKPLQAMQLEDIRLTPKNVTQSLDTLRTMKSLQRIGLHHYQSWPAAEFWKRYDAGEFTK